MFYLLKIAQLRAQLNLSEAEQHRVDEMLLHRGLISTYEHLRHMAEEAE